MLKNLIFSSLLKNSELLSVNLSCFYHTSETVRSVNRWMKNNEKIYPPQSPEETPRHAYVVNCKENIKYSPKKMWYIACLVRGLTVDEALKQLQFVQKKGAVAVRETILEAQRNAVENHNVEFKSNLWVSESFVGKGMTVKGFRRHRGGRRSVVKYRYCHYFVTLEEGKPPKDYYYFRRPKSGEELLNEWLENMRQRKVFNTL